jgi:hypothetical protein
MFVASRLDLVYYPSQSNGATMQKHAHAKMIDDLGGVADVVAYIKKRTGESITPEAVYNWKRRGVSVYMQNVVARMAVERGVSLPANFPRSWVAR